jgi:hypothetical protein
LLPSRSGYFRLPNYMSAGTRPVAQSDSKAVLSRRIGIPRDDHGKTSAALPLRRTQKQY